MKKILITILVICCAFGVVPMTKGGNDSYTCYAAVKQKTSDGTVFTAKYYDTGATCYYKIIMKKNGTKKTISTKGSGSFVAKGNILYYVQKGRAIDEDRFYNTVYKYNIKTGKSEKIVSGVDYVVCGFSRDYLYFGVENVEDIDLYALNLKTKKKKHMSGAVGPVYVSKNKVITGTNSGDAGNYPIYSFNLDGTGKKKILSGSLLSVKNEKIIYCRVNEKTWKYKVYTCSISGKNKKALTGWSERIPDKYWE